MAKPLTRNSSNRSRRGEAIPAGTHLLIPRRLDEIERKSDRIVEELRMPTAIGYSVRRGNLPRKD